MKTSPDGASVPLRPEDFVPPLQVWFDHIASCGGPSLKVPGSDGARDHATTVTMSASTLSACFVMVAHYALVNAPRYQKRSMKRDGYSLSAIAPLVRKVEVRP